MTSTTQDGVTPEGIEVAVTAASDIALAELVALYDAVGWTAYTRDPEALERAIGASHCVVTARDTAGDLVGLARTLSDEVTIVYLQDILVHPAAQRLGLGRRLVEAALAEYPDVRQVVLLTDDEPRQRAIYESLGLTEAHDHDPPLRAFVRLT